MDTQAVPHSVHMLDVSGKCGVSSSLSLAKKMTTGSGVQGCRAGGRPSSWWKTLGLVDDVSPLRPGAP